MSEKQIRLACGCLGTLKETCTQHDGMAFHRILEDQEVDRATPAQQKDAELSHLRKRLLEIAILVNATDKPFEELPKILKERLKEMRNDV